MTSQRGFKLIFHYRGLKNDAEAETFKLRYKTQDGLYLPVTFLKIVPLQSWGPAFNYSIWFVEFMGKNQENLIDQALETINLVSFFICAKIKIRI